MRNEALNKKDENSTINYDNEFHPNLEKGCQINNNEAGNKMTISAYVKDFEWYYITKCMNSLCMN